MARKTLMLGAAALLCAATAVVKSAHVEAKNAPQAGVKLAHRDRLYDAAFRGSELYVVGHPGLVLRSQDGGKSFTNVNAGQSDEALFSISFNSKGQGAIVGRAGFVLTTADGGSTWQKSLVQLDEEKPHLFSVDVLEDGAIVAVGEFGVIVRSQDGGRTFQRSTFSLELAEPAAPEGDPCASFANPEGENSDMMPEARLTDVSFADDKHGFVVGEFGLLLRSEDGGRTFIRQNSCTDKILYGVAALDAVSVLAAGAEGTVVETSDGKSWTQRETGTVEHLFGVYRDVQRAMVVGAAGTVIARTREAGFKLTPTEVHSWLTSVALDGNGRGVVVGGRGNVLGTSDGGATLNRLAGE